MDMTEQYSGVEDIAAQLSAARDAAGLDLEEMSKELCIRRAYLEAMEDARFDDLPPPAYTSGFLRSYARALGLDADALSAAYRATIGEAAMLSELQFPEPLADSRLPGRGTIAAGLAGLAIVYVGWIHDFSGTASDRSPQVADLPDRLSVIANAMATPVMGALPGATNDSSASGTTRPDMHGPSTGSADDVSDAVENTSLVVTTEAGDSAGVASLPDDAPATTTSHGPDPDTDAFSSATSPRDRVTLTAERDAWLYIVDSMNREVWKGVLREGQSWSTDRAGLTLMTGNAGGVLVSVGGRPARPLGARGVVVRDQPLDAQRLADRQGG